MGEGNEYDAIETMADAQGDATEANIQADADVHKKPDVNINEQGLPYMGERPAHSCDIFHVILEIVAMALGTEERGILSLVPWFVFAMHYGSTLRA